MRCAAGVRVRQVLLAAWCAAAPALLSAQDTVAVRRLQARLAAALPDSQRVLTLAQLSAEYRVYNLDSALHCAQQAVQLGARLRQPHVQAEAQKNLGLVRWFLADYEAALHAYDDALANYRQAADPRNQAAVTRYRGMVLIDQGRFVDAMQHFHAAQALARQAGSEYEVAGALNQMGVVYHKQKAFARARAHFEQSLGIYRRLNSQTNIALCYSNLGLALGDEGRYAEALQYQRRSLDIKLRGTDLRAIAYSRRILGELYHHMGRHAESDSSYREALRIYRQIHVPFGVMKSLVGMARNAQVRGQVADARRMGEDALTLAQHIASAEGIQEASGLLAEAYARQGDYARAYARHRLHKRMTDSLANIETARKLYDLEAAAAQERQARERAQNAAETRYQRNLLYASTGVAVLLALLLLASWRNYRRKQRDHRLLMAKSQEIAGQRTQLAAQRDELQHALDRLRATQQQLILSEKMAALGQLVANIAHELNTPISAVYTSARNAVRQLPMLVGSLPAFLRGLAPDVYVQFEAMTAAAAAQPHTATTRQERAARRRIAQLLETDWGLPAEQAQRRAAVLAPLDIEDALPRFRPLVLHPDADALLARVQALVQLQQNLRLVEAGSEQTARLVATLRTYVQAHAAGPRAPVPLPESLDRALQLYEHLLRQGVQVTRDFAPDLPPVPADADELDQVWAKLVHNAVLAMAESPVRALHVRAAAEAGGRILRVDVCDSGPGIPAEVLPRIFEPFFTTRPHGQGSGLGLAIAAKLVARYGGTIGVESRPGRTCFTVRLPLAAADAPERPQPVALPAPATHDA